MTKACVEQPRFTTASVSFFLKTMTAHLPPSTKLGHKHTGTRRNSNHTPSAVDC